MEGFSAVRSMFMPNIPRNWSQSQWYKLHSSSFRMVTDLVNVESAREAVGLWESHRTTWIYGFALGEGVCVDAEIYLFNNIVWLTCDIDRSSVSNLYNVHNFAAWVGRWWNRIGASLSFLSLEKKSISTRSGGMWVIRRSSTWNYYPRGLMLIVVAGSLFLEFFWSKVCLSTPAPKLDLKGNPIRRLAHQYTRFSFRATEKPLS